MYFFHFFVSTKNRKPVCLQPVLLYSFLFLVRIWKAGLLTTSSLVLFYFQYVKGKRVYWQSILLYSCFFFDLERESGFLNKTSAFVLLSFPHSDRNGKRICLQPLLLYSFVFFVLEMEREFANKTCAFVLLSFLCSGGNGKRVCLQLIRLYPFFFFNPEMESGFTNS